MPTYHLDYETSSPADLRKFGAARYASDPETRILLCAICKDDGPVELWDVTDDTFDQMPALQLLEEAARDPEAVIYAHNAPFEVMVSHYLWADTFGFPAPDSGKWRCTAALCRVAAIPQSLEQAAEFLKLDVLKDPVGKALIRTFSVPQKVRGKTEVEWLNRRSTKKVTVSGTKMTCEEAWDLFRQYCVKDVEVERKAHSRLKSLDLKGWVLEAFKLDIRLNLRGVPVNLDAIGNAQAIIADVESRIIGEFEELTGLKPSQGAKVLAWLKERGYPKNDLTLPSVTEVLTGEAVDEETGDAIGEKAAPMTDRMTPEAVRALTLKSQIGYAALKKLPTMRGAACPDGRLRGMFKFWGAIRTGRYSSNVVQLQNLKRPSKDSEAIFRMIRDGQADANLLDLLYGPPLSAIASGIRHYIGFSGGQQLLGADFSQIEARVLPWLAGHEKLLDAFRQGQDLYKVTIASALGKPIEDVSKDDRQLGKVLVLAAGYSGGLNAMTAACDMYGIEMPDKEKRSLVKLWRKANQPIVKLWKLVGEAAIEAVLSPGKWVAANSKVRFGCSKELGYLCLVMELPSGRRLHYPYPEVEEVYKIKRPRKGADLDNLEDDDDGMTWVPIPRYQAIGPDGAPFKGVWATHELSYYGPGKQSVVWGRTRTHGGTFVENLCQATAGDFLTLGSLNAEREGYAQILTVHDEIATEYHPEKGNTIQGLVLAMCKLPEWAKDFPLEAVGEVADFYTK